MCIQPPWRNWLVTIDGHQNHAGTTRVGADELLEAARRAGPSRSRNTSTLTAMSPMVTTGTVRDGMTSLTGNIDEV